MGADVVPYDRISEKALSKESLLAARQAFFDARRDDLKEKQNRGKTAHQLVQECEPLDIDKVDRIFAAKHAQ